MIRLHLLLALLLALFVASTLATSRREAEFPAPPSSGAPHVLDSGEVRESAVGWHPYPDPVPVRRPFPSAAMQPANAPANVAVTGSIEGTATWFAAAPGAAAAGPALRRALGPTWRGQTVTVCAVRCVRVRLTDWCRCPGNRVIDLARADFARLADPSVGVLAVVVSWGAVRLPETSTARTLWDWLRVVG